MSITPCLLASLLQFERTSSASHKELGFSKSGTVSSEVQPYPLIETIFDGNFGNDRRLVQFTNQNILNLRS